MPGLLAESLLQVVGYFVDQGERLGAGAQTEKFVRRRLANGDIDPRFLQRHGQQDGGGRVDLRDEEFCPEQNGLRGGGCAFGHADLLRSNRRNIPFAAEPARGEGGHLALHLVQNPEPAFLLRTKVGRRNKLAERLRAHRGVRGVGACFGNRAPQFIAESVEDRSHLGRRFGQQTRLLDFLEPRQHQIQGPGERHAGAVRAYNHRISCPALAVTRRPHAADEKLPGTLPKEEMREGRDLLAGVEFFPGAGIDLPADTLHVKERLGVNEALGFQPQVLHVVVPARVLAKRAQKDLARRSRPQLSNIFQQKFFVEVAHIPRAGRPQPFNWTASPPV